MFGQWTVPTRRPTVCNCRHSPTEMLMASYSGKQTGEPGPGTGDQEKYRG